MGYLLHKPPKLYNNVSLLVGLTTLETFLNLKGWFIKLSVQTFQPLIVNLSAIVLSLYIPILNMVCFLYL